MGQLRKQLSYVLFITNILNAFCQDSINDELKGLKYDDNLKQLLQEIMIKSLEPYRCVVIVSDELHQDVFDELWFRKFGEAISFLTVYVKENEDLLSPFDETQEILTEAKNEGCQLYMILLTNGIQAARLLRFADRYRLFEASVKYILLHDNRLFDSKLFYLWRRLINVLFIKRHEGRSLDKTKNTAPWFEVTTVPFPLSVTRVLIPRRLDIWAKSKFRKGTKLYPDKTSDLKNQTLKVVAFSHIPGTAKTNLTSSQTVRALLPINDNGTFSFCGTEIEIVQTVAKVLNFRCEIYEPNNADVELWGRKVIGSIYTGITGEMVNAHADIAVGDLYYTPYLLELMDLSIPYNTECLTFLTPESLTDNSWKTLIQPFKPVMWAGVIICLVLSSLAFYVLARFHIHVTSVKKDCVGCKKRLTQIPAYQEKESCNPLSIS
ncbi:hypothetical protein NQ317_016963 [Molorchus minor]|uniref:Ionotropic glutamate receptor L-glutamate and glycine-binding domain-containing protein n=1 Tax=Molorchus minor TaxID=1323400 RepID=A0ABQ9K4W5_9CUCU|nr:hypothetical protein NQ317_016963 [Molorchus minor]